MNSAHEILLADGDEKQSYAHVDQQNIAARAEVFATAAHDMRSPLTVIVTLTELMLQDDSITPVEMRQFLDAIRTNASEIHCLLDDMQEISWDPLESTCRHASLSIL